MNAPLFCKNDTIRELYCQYLENNLPFEGEVLQDKTSEGNEKPWREKKLMNENLAKVYGEIDEKKQARLLDCGKFLEFKVYADGTKKLHSMSSCRVRLCPLCAWRRSLKMFHNNLEIVKYLMTQKDYAFIFLTLTVKNCNADELTATIDHLAKAVNRLYLRPEWKKAVKGACKALEVTHNVNRKSKYFDTFHPHMHFILCVNKSYFTSSSYLSHKKWVDLWQSVLHVDYRPIVNVKKCYDTAEKAVAECSKYSVKSVEYVIPEDWVLSVNTVRVLDKALANRRLISYSGVFKTAKQILCLEDEETGSLIDVGDAVDKLDEPFVLQSYYWYSGYRQYISIEK